MSIIDEVLAVLEKGYRPYNGKISDKAKDEVNCKDWENTFWFVKETKWKRIFICLGCESRPCILSNPQGFELTMPKPVIPAKISFMESSAVHPDDLFHYKKWFRVDEASSLLNVSTRKIYNMIDEGLLVKHIDPPVRLTAESLQVEYNREEW